MNALRTTTRPVRPGEAGVALPWAIAAMVIGLFVVISMSISAIGHQRDVRARGDKVVAAPIVQAAVTKLRLGLESGEIAEYDRFMPDVADLTNVAGTTTGSTIVTNPPLTPVPQASALKNMPAPPNVAIREPSTTPGRFGFWQIFRVDAPRYSWPREQGNLRYWLRTWTGNASGASPSEVRYWRIDLRPGRFVDFKMLIDGPIQFAEGAIINGPIHTNGFKDELRVSEPPTADMRVWANDGGVTCTSKAIITSAQGTISLPGCPKQEGTGDYINLLRTEDMLDRVRRGCKIGAPTLKCWMNTHDGASLGVFAGFIHADLQGEVDLRGYHVELDDGTIRVGKFEVDPFTESVSVTPLDTVPVSVDSPMTLYFADSVVVRGTTTGRVTIIARRPVRTTTNSVGASANGAANVYIVDDVKHSGQGSSVGIVSQGGILLSAMKLGGATACVSKIEAAMIAITGTLALDPRYLTAIDQAYPALRCNNHLHIQGALAAHRSPILYWNWSSGKEVGYPSRTYEFDENLRKAPPPEFPNASSWQAITVKPANVDCLTGGNASCD